MNKIIIFDFDQTLYSGHVKKEKDYDYNMLRDVFRDLDERQFKKLLTKYGVTRKTLNPDKVVEIALAEGKDTIHTISPYLDEHDEHMAKSKNTHTIDNEVLKNLAIQGYTIYVVSNSPTNNVLRNCKSLGIDTQHINVLGMRHKVGMIGYHKAEKNDRYLQVMNIEKVLPQDCIVFGNSKNADLVPAISLGMRAVHCTDANYLTLENIINCIEDTNVANIETVLPMEYKLLKNLERQHVAKVATMERNLTVDELISGCTVNVKEQVKDKQNQKEVQENVIEDEMVMEKLDKFEKPTINPVIIKQQNNNNRPGLQ